MGASGNDGFGNVLQAFLIEHLNRLMDVLVIGSILVDILNHI